MRHTNWTGTHLECGRMQGELLRMENRPFQDLFAALSEERYSFAEACIPIYEREAPALLEELRGLAEGARTPFREAAAFLLGMYAFPAGHRCTCFAIDTGADVLFGRNSDFLTAAEPLYERCRYRLHGAYAFVGTTTAFSEIEDGVNENGLAVGMTFTYPTVRKPGIHAGYLVRYLLERCRNVQEAIAALRRLTIGSSQTLTLADASGGMAVVECNAERLVVRRPMEVRCPMAGGRFAAAVNDFYAPEMLPYRCAMEDDLHSGLRWQTVNRALRDGRVRSLEDACKLLSGRFGFLCQYDREAGFDTVWSVACGLRSRKVLFCAGNPARGDFLEEPSRPVRKPEKCQLARG